MAGSATTTSTTRFKADITDFRSSMQEIKRVMNQANAEFKKSAAACDDWSSDLDGLRAKTKQLNTILNAQERELEVLNEEYKKTVKEQGENSASAQKLKTRITNQEAAIISTKKSLTQYQDKISSTTKNSNTLSDAFEGQKSKLKNLKSQFTSIISAEDKNSKSTKQLKNDVGKLNSEFSKHESKLKDVKQGLEHVGNGFKNAASAAGSAAMGGIAQMATSLTSLVNDCINQAVNGLTQLTKAAVSTGEAFTKSASYVGALSGMSDAEMQRIENKAKELGKSTQFTSSQIMDAFGYMALAGWDCEAMLASINSILTLSAASGMDLAAVSDLITDNLTAFSLSASDANKFADELAVAMSNSNTNVAQLGEAYKSVAATAASLGYSVEDTTALLMGLADGGVKGSEAGSALNAIMTRLATDTKDCASQLAEFAQQSGRTFSVYDDAGNMRNLGNILQEMSDIWGNLTTQEQANLAKIIAGTSHYSQLQIIMNNLSKDAQKGGKSFQQYAALLRKTAKDTASGFSASAQMAEKMNDNLTGDKTKMSSAWDDVKLGIFENIEQPLRELVQYITNNFIPFFKNEIAPSITSGLRSAIKKIPYIINRLVSFYNDIRRVFYNIKQQIKNSKVGKLISDMLSSISKAFSNWFASGNLFGSFESKIYNVVDGILVILDVLVGNILKLKKKIDEIPLSFGDIVTFFVGLKNYFKDFANILIEIVSPSIENLKKSFSNLAGVVSPSLKKLSDAFAKWIGNHGPAKLLGEIISSSFDLVSKTISNIANAIPIVMNSVLGLKNYFKDFYNVIAEMVAPSIENLKQSFSNLIDAFAPIGDALNPVFQKLSDKFGEWIGDQGPAKLFGEVISSAFNIVAEIINKIADAIPIVVDGIIALKDYFVDFYNIIVESVTPSIEDLRISFENLIASIAPIGDALNPAFQKLSDEFGKWIGDQGPAKLLGKYISASFDIIAGCINYVADTITVVREAFSRFVEDVKNSKEIQDIIKRFKESWDELCIAIKPVVDLFKELFAQWNEGLDKGTALNLITDTLRVGLDLVAGTVALLIDGLSSLIKVITWIINLFVDLVNKLKTVPSLVKSLVESIASLFSSLPSLLHNIGSQMLSGLWDGIKSFFPNLANGIASLGNEILNGFKSIFDIHSPSRVMKNEIGKNISLGIADGILSSKKSVQSALNSVSAGLENGLNLGVNANINGKAANAPASSQVNNYYTYNINDTINTTNNTNRLDRFIQKKRNVIIMATS